MAAAACLIAMTASADPAGPPTSSITLEWTAPGDDATYGVAARYDLRYSLEPISNANFGLANAVSNVPRPVRPGLRQKVHVDGLQPDTRYYFGLKTLDDAGNWSGLSNVVAKTSPDPLKTPLSSGIELGPPSPNPARKRTLLRLSLPVATDARIDVFDAGGRWVRTLVNARMPAGVTPIQWVLRDHGDQPLGSGVYWIRAVFGADVRTQRLVVIR